MKPTKKKTKAEQHVDRVLGKIRAERQYELKGKSQTPREFIDNVAAYNNATYTAGEVSKQIFYHKEDFDRAWKRGRRDIELLKDQEGGRK